MFIAFTETLKYNKFYCAKTPEAAKEGLVKSIVDYFTEGDVQPRYELDDDGCLQLFDGCYEYGYICTCVHTMEVTPSGVGFHGDKPTMYGEWIV